MHADDKPCLLKTLLVSADKLKPKHYPNHTGYLQLMLTFRCVLIFQNNWPTSNARNCQIKQKVVERLGKREAILIEWMLLKI